MRIGRISGLLPSFIETAKTKISNCLPQSVKKAISSVAESSYSAPRSTSSSQASTIHKINLFSLKLITLIGTAYVASQGFKEVQATPATTSFPDLFTREETPFSYSILMNDLFGTNPTYATPYSCTIQQFDGTPLPAGLTSVNQQLNTVALTSILGGINFFNKLNNYLITETGQYVTTIIDISNPLSPQQQFFVPFSQSTQPVDMACNQNTSMCLINSNNEAIQEMHVGSNGGTVNPNRVAWLPNLASINYDPTNNLVATLSSYDGLDNVIFNLQFFKFTNGNMTFISNYTELAAYNTISGLTIGSQTSCVIAPNLLGVPTLYVYNLTDLKAANSNNYDLTTYPVQLLQKKDYCIIIYPSGIATYNLTQLVSSFDFSASTSLSSATLSEDGNRIYTFSLYQINQVDIYDIENPYLIASHTTQVAPQSTFGTTSYRNLALQSGSYLFIADQQGLRVTTKDNSIKISGTPQGGTAGNSTYYVNCLDANGKQVGNKAIAFNFYINRAVNAISSVPNQLLIVGVAKTIDLANLFQHFQNNQIFLSLNPIPSSCNFNPSAATLTCTQTVNDVGVRTLTLRGTDALNAFDQLSFQITTVFAPFVANPIPNLIAEVGYPVFINATNTIQSNGEPLSCLFTGPSYLKYNNGSITGTPALKDVALSQATLTCTIQQGLSATASFGSTVEQVQPPQIDSTASGALQNLVAPAHKTYTLLVPKPIFVDPLGRDAIQKSYVYMTQLPTFLSADTTTDPQHIIVTGTPGWLDVGLAVNSVYTLGFTACRSNVSTACNQFSAQLTVSGMLLGSLIAALASAAVSALTLYWKRWTIWNSDFIHKTFKKLRIYKVIGCCGFGPTSASFYLMPAETVVIGSEVVMHTSHHVRTHRCCLNILLNRKIHLVKAYIRDESYSHSCIAGIWISCTNLFKSKHYISHGNAIIEEAGLVFNRDSYIIQATKLLEPPAKFRNVVIQIVNSNDGILGEFDLSIIYPENQTKIAMTDTEDFNEPSKNNKTKELKPPPSYGASPPSPRSQNRSMSGLPVSLGSPTKHSRRLTEEELKGNNLDEDFQLRRNSTNNPLVKDEDLIQTDINEQNRKSLKPPPPRSPPPTRSLNHSVSGLQILKEKDMEDPLRKNSTNPLLVDLANSNQV